MTLRDTNTPMGKQTPRRDGDGHRSPPGTQGSKSESCTTRRPHKGAAPPRPGCDPSARPRRPSPAPRRHSPPKRPELSMGPGKRLGSPAPNISQLSKPTYFFHCLNHRLSTRYLQHTAPGGAAPSAAARRGAARPAPTGPTARRGGGRRGGPAGRAHQDSPGLRAVASSGPSSARCTVVSGRAPPPPPSAAAMSVRKPRRGRMSARVRMRTGWACPRWPRPARAPSDVVGGAARAGRAPWRRAPSCSGLWGAEGRQAVGVGEWQGGGRPWSKSVGVSGCGGPRLGEGGGWSASPRWLRGHEGRP